MITTQTVRKIAVAIVLLSLVASCRSTDTYEPAAAPAGGLTIVKEAGKADESAGGALKAPKLEAVGGSVEEREAVAELYMRAQKHFYDGEPWLARALLERVGRGQPHYGTVLQFIELIDLEIAGLEMKAAIEREETDIRDRKVFALFRKAESAYNAKRYNDALESINEAYRLDPHSEKVRMLRADARIAKANEDMLLNDLGQDARLAEVMATVEKVATVPSELPRAPRPDLEPKPDPYADEAKTIEEKLNQRISVNLHETPLEYLLNILFRASGVNIIAKPGDLEGQTITVHAEEIRLIELLDYISNTLGVSFTRSGNAIWIQGGGQTSDGPMMKWRVIPLDRGIIDVASQEASETSDLEKALEMVPELITWPDGSQYYLDRMNNKLLVRTTSEAHKEFKEFVEAMDITPIQILIETKFIEISTDKYSDFGITWNLNSGLPISKEGSDHKLEISGAVGDTTTGVTLPPPVTPPTGLETSGLQAILSGVLTVPEFNATLRALKATGHTSTLAEPRIVVVNNSTAELEITRDEYYVKDYEVDRENLEGTTINVDDTGTNTTQYTTIIKPVYEKEEVGFKLKVTANVGKNLKDITLILEPEITQIVSTLTTPIASTAEFEEGGADDLVVEQPILSKRIIKVKLIVSDGYVVAMGGLMTQEKSKGETKVPLLGDIPLLGHLFRRESELNKKTNLLIFVSAKIITSEGRMLQGAGPGTLNLGGPMDEAIELRDRATVEIIR